MEYEQRDTKEVELTNLQSTSGTQEKVHVNNFYQVISQYKMFRKKSYELQKKRFVSVKSRKYYNPASTWPVFIQLERKQRFVDCYKNIFHYHKGILSLDNFHINRIL